MFAELKKLAKNLLSFEGDSGVKCDRGIPHVKAMNQLLETSGIGAFLNYDAYLPEHHVFINQDTLGFCFECVPLTGASEDSEVLFHELINTTLPELSYSGFILLGMGKTADQLRRYINPREIRIAEQAQRVDRAEAALNQDPHNPELLHQVAVEKRQLEAKEVFYQLALERARHISKVDYQAVRDFRLFFWVSYGNPESEEDLEEMAGLVKSTEQALVACNLAPRAMDNHDLITYANLIFSADDNVEVESFKANDWDPLCYQCNLSKSHVRAADSGMGILINGNKRVQSFSCTQFPRNTYLSGMTNMVGHVLKSGLQIKSNFALSLTLHVPDQSEWSTYNNTRKLQWLDTAGSSKAAIVPNAKETAEDLSLAFQRTGDGERYVRVCYQVFCFSKLENAAQDEKDIKTLHRTEGFQLNNNRCLSLPAFLCGLLPMWCNVPKGNDLYHRGLFQTVLSYNAACLLPVIAEWKGSARLLPLTVLTGRRGQLFGFNNFDNPTKGGNFNMGVWGKPGTGKSVFLQEIALGTLSLGGLVRSIDIGRSQEKTCRSVQGEFINFSADSHISLNFFTHIKQLTREYMKLIKPLIGQMCLQKRDTTDAEDGLIEKAIMQAYAAQGQQTTITHIHQILEKSNEPEANTLAKSLFSYTEQGMHGKFFNPPANIDLSNPYVVLELGELEDTPDLQRVVLMTLLFHINEEVYLSKNRKQNKLCILDEGWALLPSEKTSEGDFFNALGRRGRKHGGGLIIGSQSLADLYNSNIGQVLAGLMDWNAFLGLTPESIEFMVKQDYKKLNAYQQEVLRSLETVGGQYSEIMLFGPQGWALGRLMLDPFSDILMSSQADDFTRVLELEEQGLSVREAVEQRAKEVHGDY